jgi:hypothetical protein
VLPQRNMVAGKQRQNGRHGQESAAPTKGSHEIRRC